MGRLFLRELPRQSEAQNLRSWQGLNQAGLGINQVLRNSQAVEVLGGRQWNWPDLRSFQADPLEWEAFASSAWPSLYEILLNERLFGISSASSVPIVFQEPRINNKRQRGMCGSQLSWARPSMPGEIHFQLVSSYRKAPRECSVPTRCVQRPIIHLFKRIRLQLDAEPRVANLWSLPWSHLVCTYRKNPVGCLENFPRWKRTPCGLWRLTHAHVT